MMRRFIPALAAVACICMAGSGKALAEPLSADEFRQELVGLPLCGTPKTGALAGKTVCTLHLADGSAVLAGAGLLVRGSWEAEGRRICRRTANDPMDRRRCVEYERMGPQRYSNSDGVEFCVGPCSE